MRERAGVTVTATVAGAVAAAVEPAPAAELRGNGDRAEDAVAVVAAVLERGAGEREIGRAHV